jgi:hypothetical protein
MMRVLKKLFNFYLNSSIHVALAVYSLTWITLLENDIPYDENVLYFTFYATITGYNFVKYFGVARFHHRSLTNWLKAVQVFSFICFVLMCYYAFQLSTKALLYVFGFGIITFLYAIPFLPKRFFLDSQHNLRSIGGLKIYLIALVWSGVVVFLPLVENNFVINNDAVLTGIQRFIFTIVLILPFEIRDLRYDSLKLSTVPQQIGVKQTKLIGSVLLMIFFLIELFKDEISFTKNTILLIVVLVTFIFLIFSKTEQRKYYSAFWVEGIPIFWLILMVLFY